jgi:hypothetical protein
LRDGCEREPLPLDERLWRPNQPPAHQRVDLGSHLSERARDVYGLTSDVGQLPVKLSKPLLALHVDVEPMFGQQKLKYARALDNSLAQVLSQSELVQGIGYGRALRARDDHGVRFHFDACEGV